MANYLFLYDAVYVAFAVHGHSQMVTAERILTTRPKSAETKQKPIMLADLAP
jgi:predicted nucleic acid-binding protein